MKKINKSITNQSMVNIVVVLVTVFIFIQHSFLRCFLAFTLNFIYLIYVNNFKILQFLRQFKLSQFFNVMKTSGHKLSQVKLIFTVRQKCEQIHVSYFGSFRGSTVCVVIGALRRGFRLICRCSHGPTLTWQESFPPRVTPAHIMLLVILPL